MTDLDQVLKAGSLLIIETGEYSDSSWAGPVRLLKDARKADLAETYRDEWKPDPARPWEDHAEPHGFLPWLIKAGWAEAVEDVHSWHVGSYGRFEPEL